MLRHIRLVVSNDRFLLRMRLQVNLGSLRQRVAARRPQPSDDRPGAVVLPYLDRYGKSPFGHPLARGRGGRRSPWWSVHTNGFAEHSFAVSKQKLRRRLGGASLGRVVEDQPAQAALAADLLCPHSLRIMGGTPDRLPQAFLALGRWAISATMPL